MALQKNLQIEVQNLRRQGKTYAEIRGSLGREIPKSTLSYWCRQVDLSQTQKEDLARKQAIALVKARSKALEALKIKRKNYIDQIELRNAPILRYLKKIEVAKIVLATLYIAEGGKNRSSLMLGNADPGVIALFLSLLRFCYPIDESKFRCTLQLRADQDAHSLEKFWISITRIPASQFYKARFDPRSIGKRTQKVDYKGVCRIDYLSSELFQEVTSLGRIILKGS